MLFVSEEFIFNVFLLKERSYILGFIKMTKEKKIIYRKVVSLDVNKNMTKNTENCITLHIVCG